MVYDSIQLLFWRQECSLTLIQSTHNGTKMAPHNAPWTTISYLQIIERTIIIIVVTPSSSSPKRANHCGGHNSSRYHHRALAVCSLQWRASSVICIRHHQERTYWSSHMSHVHHWHGSSRLRMIWHTVVVWDYAFAKNVDSSLCPDSILQITNHIIKMKICVRKVSTGT